MTVDPIVDQPPYEPDGDWVGDQMDEHGDDLVAFCLWLHGQGLLPTEEHPTGAAGDNDRDLDQLVDEFLRGRPDADGDVLLQHLLFLDGQDVLVPDSYRVAVPGTPPPADDIRSDIEEWFRDQAVSQAEAAAERCCRRC